MINFTNLMLTLTITATILTLFLLLLEKFLGIKEIYVLLKVIGGFCLIPAVIIVAVYIFHSADQVQKIHTDDFSEMVINNGLRKFSERTDPEILQMNKTAFVVWLIGFVLTFVAGLIKAFVHLMHIVHRCNLANNNIRRLAEELKKEMRIIGEIPIYHSDSVRIPFTAGILNKKVILPKMNLSENEWKMILKHEFIHCIRQDVFMKILVRLVQKIHWFNPVLVIYRRKFDEISEYTCDIDVVENYDKNEKWEYGCLILKMSKDSQDQKLTIGFSNKSVRILKKRMEYIMHSKHAVRKTSAIITAIAFMMLCPLITYASASGMEILQNNVVLKYHGDRSVEVSPSVKFDSQIMTDHSGSVNRQVSYLSHLDPRGINNIDTTISSDGELQMGLVLLDSNSNIRVVISSEHESDKFRVGIIDPDKTRHYINSEQGVAVKTFKISSKGLYTVYIEGRNGKNGNRIYITGTIFINN